MIHSRGDVVNMFVRKYSPGNASAAGHAEQALKPVVAGARWFKRGVDFGV
jgi:hypothetical protein